MYSLYRKRGVFNYTHLYQSTNLCNVQQYMLHLLKTIPPQQLIIIKGNAPTMLQEEEYEL